MGRYDKIRVFNGSSWVQPNNMYVFNGSSWVHYGDNNSYATNTGYAYTGSTWNRITLNRQDFTTYNGAVKVLGQQGAGETTGTFSTTDNSNTLVSTNSPACGVITASTRRYHAAWTSPLRMMLDKTLGGASYGWAGTSTNNDSTEDWHQFEWTNPMWVHAFRFATADSSFIRTAPFRAEVSFKLSNGTWTGETTYTMPTAAYTARNAWANDYFWINYQIPGGVYGIKMRYLNNTNYHTDIQSTRIGEIEMHLGTIGTGTNWV